ncbi:hypothetical protein HYH03_018004 [Edaphochlamys debaryana]|uniref:Potassium transporter n=1 Tax=Edaphochlamys debaryana TaxID=47281 RepID=A0A836BPV2_9CHLO|nr:hypothetical protein HYH03_018004 [Edaphochlamys debaryana]|eukprot:KAG2483114.1 hypothetical protein HYH03_018004 [Edaphochlamys debaryana]
MQRAPPRRGGADVLGIMSLIFWTLTLEVLVKYCGIVLAAGDEGQGGTFALCSLLCRHIGIRPHGVRGPGGAPAPAPAPAPPPGTDKGEGGAGANGTSPHDTAHHSGTIAAHPTSPLPASVARWWAPPRWAQRLAAASSALTRANAEWTRAFFRGSRSAQRVLWGASVIGTAMLLGDGVLTPSISVLSAVSGLQVAVPSLSQGAVVGITIAVLALVFSLQRLGTGTVSRCFAPVIALWLLANAAIGCWNLAQHGAGVFRALDPSWMGTYFAHNGAAAWRVRGPDSKSRTQPGGMAGAAGGSGRMRSLGSVMLCVTGAEALFADLGHFSRGSITAASTLLAYPCLVITYLGQSAFLIRHPLEKDAFWKSLPSQVLYPMLVLATLAAIVASQALISGVFSIVRQAMLLGAFPPVQVVFTGGSKPGAATQVYVPLVNALLFVLCCAVVAGFGSTVALGKAYGLAVMTDMVTTTCLVSLVMVTVWEASPLLVAAFLALFLAVEGAYWSANIVKVHEGGWFTVAVAVAVAALMLSCGRLSRPTALTLASSGGGGSGSSRNGRAAAAGAAMPSEHSWPPSAAVAQRAAAAAYPAGPELSFGDGPAAGVHGGAVGLARASPFAAAPKHAAVAAAAAAAAPAAAGYTPRAALLALELPAALLAAPPESDDGGSGGGSEAGGEADGVCEPVAEADPPPLLVVPLTRLDGIGVYYLDESMGDGLAAEEPRGPELPPVLVHFLRNVQAVHTVGVFLCVRRLPTPSVPRGQRLSVRTDGGLPPNFYRAVAVYGYLDVVDHGPAFLSELLDGVRRALRAHPPAPAPALPPPLHPPPSDAPAGDGGALGRSGGDCGGGGCVKARAEAAVAAFLEAELAGVVYYASRPRLRTARPAAPPPTASSSPTSASAPPASAPSTRRPARNPLHALLAALTAPLASALSAACAWARSCGCWLALGVLYRGLAAVAVEDMERWRVPPEALVELGLAVDLM